MNISNFEIDEIEYLIKEIGTIFQKTRSDIEEINLGNSTCYYPYAEGNWIYKDKNYQYKFVYYIDDTGFIYESILEKINNKRASEHSNCPVNVKIVGLLLEED